MERNYTVKLNPQTRVVNGNLVTIEPEVKVRENDTDITVWESYKVNNWADIKLACTTIKNKSDEIANSPAHTRSIKSMAHEWAAHNVLYSLRGEDIRKKCVDVNFTTDDTTLMKLRYWALAMVHHILYGW